MMAQRVSWIVYCHGVGGDPHRGQKVSAIREFAKSNKIEVLAPNFNESDTVSEMIDFLAMEIETHNIDLSASVLLGSSRGAYICAMLCSRTQNSMPGGVLLLAPPVGIKPEYYTEDFPIPVGQAVDVVHGYDDQLIPVKNVIEYCHTNKLRLHLIDEGHRLTDEKEFIINLLNFQRLTIEETTARSL